MKNDLNAVLSLINDLVNSSFGTVDEVSVVPDEADVRPVEDVVAFNEAELFCFSASNFASSAACFLFVFDLVYNGMNTPNDNNENTILPI